MGSTPDQAARAKALASVATMRAVEAMKRTAAMRLQAARAHDRAAQLHELLAEAGQGDVQEHRERAAAHRQQALDDRAVVTTIARSQHIEQPDSGHS